MFQKRNKTHDFGLTDSGRCYKGSQLLTDKAAGGSPLAQEKTNTAVELTFEGPEVESGTIDVRELAPALLAINDLCQRTNTLVNGSRAEIAVRVDARLESGSFDVLLQIINAASDVAQRELAGVKSATEIARILGLTGLGSVGIASVLKLAKWFGGKLPELVKLLPDGTVQIGLKNELVQVQGDVYNTYADQRVREGLAQLASPLRKHGIERLRIRENKKDIEELTKEDADRLSSAAFDLSTADPNYFEGERTAVLQISKISFKDDNKWSFTDGSSKLNATIEDEVFLHKVHSREIAFADGDLLKARIRWRTWRGNGRLHTENIVIEVIEVIPGPRQMELSDEDGTT